MQHDQACLVLSLTQEIGHASRDERVADSMKSILPQPVLLCDFLANGVGTHMQRERGMELAIKDRNVPHVRQLLHTEPDNVQRRRVVQWRQVGERLEAMVRVPRDDLWPVEIAAVHHAVACDFYVFLLGDLLEVRVIDQLVEHAFECIVLGGNLAVDALPLGYGLAIPSVLQFRGRGRQAVDLRLRQFFWFLPLRSAVN